MFKPKAAGSFASKIAHTTTIPAFGNKDLKLLQDLITNEKTILMTLQKLALDFAKASEALKSWGLGEGEDLGDVLTHATNIYAHISAALNNFANHEHTVRAHLKSIRSREEKLDEIKRKRKGVASKADAADKKLSKMSGENKNLPAQTDLLNKLRDEIRQLDTDIMVEEAQLGDFKRRSTRNFMALKLGGLLEFGEKATIVGELGKLLIEEIPLEPTPPGQPRAFYASHPKTENLDAEVGRCVGEVIFSAPSDAGDALGTYPLPDTGRGSEDAPPADGGPASGGLPLPQQLAHDGTGEFGEPGQGHRRFESGSVPVRTGDDGARIGMGIGGGGGGQFSTFPVKSRASTAGAGGAEPSFSAAVADALREPEFGGGAGAPAVNVGGNPWDGDEYAGGGHARVESQDSVRLPYDLAAGQQQQLGVEKGVRFRTPSMEVSGAGPVAPGIASPVYPSAGAGWAGRSPLYDAPVSPVRAEPDDARATAPPDDEHARNAAAAREVARELDALQLTLPDPPPSPQHHYLSQIPAPLQPTRPLSIHRAPSPLAPPSAPFAQPRSVSPTPPAFAAPAQSPPAVDTATPYTTPPEYPAAPSPTPAAGRTISAAAFKRPGRAGSDADGAKKRPLPASPHPVRSGLARTASQEGLARGGPAAGAPPPDYFPPQREREGSPVQSDYGSLGNVWVANEEGAGAGAGSPGYSQNRFVTNLEE